MSMFSSRKFWYTVVGILTTVLSEKFGLDPEEVKGILLSNFSTCIRTRNSRRC